jgi:peptidoglycan biosynthesis protein MviN/MurJ (putative lipid II flippase)
MLGAPAALTMPGASAASPTGERRVARSGLVTAVSLIVTMALGGLLSLLIALEFGKSATTDGLFAAYSVYGVLALVAQSLRTTMVARLVEGRSLSASIDLLLGPIVVLLLACAVPLVLLGAPLASLLTGDLGEQARDAARPALAILWLAAGGQLIAALSAAALGTLDEFGLPALAYVLGALTAVISLLALEPALGIDAVATGVLIGSLVTAGLVLGRLLRRGYRPRLKLIARPQRPLRTIGVILGGAAGYMLFYLTLVVSVLFAARIGEGEATLYSYAFFAAVMVMGATSGTAGVVMAAPLSQTWDGRAASLEPHLLAVLRTSLVLILPVLSIAALVGDTLVELVLGSSFSGADADALVATFLALSGMIVSSVAMSVPLLAAFSAGRYRQVAAIAAAAMAVHVGGSAIALEIGRLYVLGIATSVSVAIALVLVLVSVYRRDAAPTARLLLVELARVAVRVIAAFAPVWIAAELLGGGSWLVAAAIVGLALVVLLVRRTLPDHWELLLRITRRSAPERETAAPA